LERLEDPKSLGSLYITANVLVYDLVEKVSAVSTAARKPVHLQQRVKHPDFGAEATLDQVMVVLLHTLPTLRLLLTLAHEEFGNILEGRLISDGDPEAVWAAFGQLVRILSSFHLMWTVTQLNSTQNQYLADCHRGWAQVMAVLLHTLPALQSLLKLAHEEFRNIPEGRLISDGDPEAVWAAFRRLVQILSSFHLMWIVAELNGTYSSTLCRQCWAGRMALHNGVQNHLQRHKTCFVAHFLITSFMVFVLHAGRPDGLHGLEQSDQSRDGSHRPRHRVSGTSLQHAHWPGGPAFLLGPCQAAAPALPDRHPTDFLFFRWHPLP
jgi:hypothetical protein